jgi:hypothetical protein
MIAATMPRNDSEMAAGESIARDRRPVDKSDNAKSIIEMTQQFPTTSAIFRGWCLLIAD